MAVILIRTVILYIFTVLTMRIMGKRQIGELETSELVVTILISELVTLPMQDADYPLVYAFIPVFALVGMELLTSVSLMKSRLFRNFLSGSYSVIIADGKLVKSNLVKAKMSRSQISGILKKYQVKSEKDVFFLSVCDGQVILIKKDQT